MERSNFLEDSESRYAWFGERYFLVFWKCTGAARGRSSADAPGHTPCGSFKWFQCATWKESRPSRCKWSQIWFTRPEAWREKNRGVKEQCGMYFVGFSLSIETFSRTSHLSFFLQNGSPWECSFPMIWNYILRCFLLHSQGRFDSFACDSCQFPWGTPHLVKALEKKTKQNNISRLFGRGGPAKTFWKEVKTLEKQKKYQKTKKHQKHKKTHLNSLEGEGPSQDSLISLVFPRFFLVLVTFSNLHLFVHWPFGVFMRSSLQEPTVSPLQLWTYWVWGSRQRVPILNVRPCPR